MDVFKSIFDWIGDKLEFIINAIVMLLPNSPFSFVEIPSEFEEWLQWVNWFIPFGTFIAIGESWITCIAIYYAVQAILRWTKTIE